MGLILLKFTYPCFPLHYFSLLSTSPPLPFPPFPPSLCAGPVVCIVPFKTEEEVIRRANSVDYGLAASVWSQEVGKLTRVAQALRVS